MELKNLSANTQRTYLTAVTGIAKHYHKSPEKLSKVMIEDYLLYLKNDKGKCPNTCASALSGLRFFYKHVTKQKISIDYSLSRKVRNLPTVLTKHVKMGRLSLPIIPIKNSKISCLTKNGWSVYAILSNAPKMCLNI